MGEIVGNVMLNSFQHLIKSLAYKTLKYPESSSGQGDEIVVATQSLKGGSEGIIRIAQTGT